MTLTELVEKRNTVREELRGINAQIVEHVEMQRRMLDGVVAEIVGGDKSRKRSRHLSPETRAKRSEFMRAQWATAKANGTRLNARRVQ